MSGADGRLPEFFIVGHHKSGTTALHEMLRRHPQLFLPDVKEPRWFDTDLHDLARRAPGLPRTWEQYLALFAPAGADQVPGEASPSYLRSSAAAEAIASAQPAARCIAILREPASFVRSLHLQMVQDRVEDERDLGRALASERRERGGRVVHRYSDHIHYVEQLRRYRRVLPDDQLLVLIYDDFRADNEATVRKVLRFLGVDDAVTVAAREANPTVAVRSVRANRTLRRLQEGRGPVFGAARAAARALAPAHAREGALRAVRERLLYTRPEPPDEDLMSELRARFRPEVHALAEYLDRDLVGLWGYR